jgi:uncharacterized protein YlxW (UPF0749 family)
MNEEMDPSELDIEVQLRRALRVKAAPAGLAERILAKTQPKRRDYRMWAIAAVLLLGVLMTSLYWNERQRRMEAEQTAAKLESALRFAAKQLEKTQEKMNASQTRVITLDETKKLENW